MEPIYRIQRRDDAAPAVERIVPQRLLTPEEREDARRRREAKRAEVAKRPRQKSELKIARQGPIISLEATRSRLRPAQPTRSNKER